MKFKKNKFNKGFFLLSQGNFLSYTNWELSMPSCLKLRRLTMAYIISIFNSHNQMETLSPVTLFLVELQNRFPFGYVVSCGFLLTHFLYYHCTQAPILSLHKPFSLQYPPSVLPLYQCFTVSLPKMMGKGCFHHFTIAPVHMSSKLNKHN